MPSTYCMCTFFSIFAKPRTRLTCSRKSTKRPLNSRQDLISWSLQPQTDRHTDTQTHRQTHRQTDTQTDGQTDGQTDTQTDTRTDRHTDKFLVHITQCKTRLSWDWSKAVCRQHALTWAPYRCPGLFVSGWCYCSIRPSWAPGYLPWRKADGSPCHWITHTHTHTILHNIHVHMAMYVFTT